MTYSLNELESLCRKAARGAGYSWGLAEDAGKAVKYLTTLGLPGAENLAGLLTKNDGGTFSDTCPDISQPVWRAPAGSLCPITTGACISDYATLLESHDCIELAKTDFPLLLLPFVVGAAETADQALNLSWPEFSASISPDKKLILKNKTNLMPDSIDAVHISKTTHEATAKTPSVTRVEFSKSIAGTLTELAHRTYAPETDERRMAGAGAGLTDND